jgi:hypothetical protein
MQRVLAGRARAPRRAKEWAEQLWSAAIGTAACGRASSPAAGRIAGPAAGYVAG